MQKYKHLSLEEREWIFAWLTSGKSLREVARRLNRNVGTISREVKRNTKYGKTYMPCVAQRRYERVTVQQRSKAPLKSPEVFLYVRQHLRAPYHLTPGQISGRLSVETKNRLHISAECIYQYIYVKKNRKERLWRYLVCGRKTRMVKNGRKKRNVGKVPNAVSIDKRSQYIEKRKQVGHWETDDMEGSKSSKAALSVSRERATRYTRLVKMVNQTKVVKTAAVVESLNMFSRPFLRTITQDNGKENYGHEQTALQLGTKMYFCHAYTSCEKGGVERAIKDIRRFIPKGTPLTKVSRQKIEYVEWWLNNRPMKCLGYMTPHEKMEQLKTKLAST